MKKKIIIILLFGAFTAGIWWYAEGRQAAAPELQQLAQRAGEAVQQATQGVSAPPPLKAPQGSTSSATLTRSGVVKWTDLQRRDNGGLPPLQVDAKLEAAAASKLSDLFAKQYFEHVSPTGIGPADLAKQAGYDYVVIGENLALGNFKDDQALVQAWMDSPGHRANILNTGYTQIGVAVGQGTYEGRRTWIAVQEFGKPKSACPAVDDALRASIDADEASIKTMEAQAQQEKADLDATPRPRTPAERDAYNRKVDAYNALISQANALSQRIQGEISVYNGQVQAYNACANS